MTRHPLDVVSLVAGVLFAGLGVAFLLDALDAWSADITWVPSIVLIGLGLAGVLSTVARQPARRGYDDELSEP
jgi:hypothetical protein